MCPFSYSIVYTAQVAEPDCSQSIGIWRYHMVPASLSGISPSVVPYSSRRAAAYLHNNEPIQTSEESKADHSYIHTKDATSTSFSYETSTQLEISAVGVLLSDTQVPISLGQQSDPTVNGGINFTEVDLPAVTFGNSGSETPPQNTQGLTLVLPNPSDTQHSITLTTGRVEPGVSTSSCTGSGTDTSLDQLNGAAQYSFSSLDGTQLVIPNTEATVDTSPADIHPIEFMEGTISEKEQAFVSTVFGINPTPYITHWAQYANHAQGTIDHNTQILVITPGVDEPGRLTLDTVGPSRLSVPETHHISTTISHDHSPTFPMTTHSIENPLASATTNGGMSPSPNHSTNDGSSLSRSITKESLASIFASVSGAGVLACCIIVFHRLCYNRLVRFKKRNRAIRKRQDKPRRNKPWDTDQNEEPEISRFSADS